jgi:hypothetical protein
MRDALRPARGMTVDESGGLESGGARGAGGKINLGPAIALGLRRYDEWRRSIERHGRSQPKPRQSLPFGGRQGRTKISGRGGEFLEHTGGVGEGVLAPIAVEHLRADADKAHFDVPPSDLGADAEGTDRVHVERRRRLAAAPPQHIAACYEFPALKIAEDGGDRLRREVRDAGELGVGNARLQRDDTEDGALVSLADMDRLNTTPDHRDVARSFRYLRHHPPLRGHGHAEVPQFYLSVHTLWKGRLSIY